MNSHRTRRARRGGRVGVRARMELSPQQPWAGPPVAAVIPTVTPVIVPVLSPIAAVVAAVTPPLATSEQAGSIFSVSEQSHLHAPFTAASRSASTAAMSAWVGIRPLASSSPPDRRIAEPNGAAHVFSQTSTAAALPGVCGESGGSLIAAKPRPVDVAIRTASGRVGARAGVRHTPRPGTAAARTGR